MREIGCAGIKVCGAKLLRRLESKNIIEEPPESERPILPSARKWGRKRGYCYVVSKIVADAFSFEGNSYHFVHEKGKTYLYTLNGNFKIQRKREHS